MKEFNTHTVFSHDFRKLDSPETIISKTWLVACYKETSLIQLWLRQTLSKHRVDSDGTYKVKLGNVGVTVLSSHLPYAESLGHSAEIDMNDTSGYNSMPDKQTSGDGFCK